MLGTFQVIPFSHAEMYSSLVPHCPMVLHSYRKKFSCLELYWVPTTPFSTAPLCPFRWLSCSCFFVINLLYNNRTKHPNFTSGTKTLVDNVEKKEEQQISEKMLSKLPEGWKQHLRYWFRVPSIYSSDHTDYLANNWYSLILGL